MKIPKSITSFFKRKPKARGAVGPNHANQGRPIYYRPQQPRPRNVEDINPVPSYALPAKHTAIPADVTNNLRYYRHPNGQNYPFPPQHPSIGPHPQPTQLPRMQEPPPPAYQHRPEQVRDIASYKPKVEPEVHAHNLSRESYGKLSQNEKQLTSDIKALERQLIGKSFSDPDYLDTLQALGKLKAERTLTRNEIAKYSGQTMSPNTLNEARADLYTTSNDYRHLGQNRPSPPPNSSSHSHNSTASRVNQPAPPAPAPSFYGSYMPTTPPSWKYTQANNSSSSLSSTGSYTSGNSLFSSHSASSSTTSFHSNGSGTSYYAHSLPPSQFTSSTSSFQSSFSTAKPYPSYKPVNNFSYSNVPYHNGLHNGVNRPANSYSYDTSLLNKVPPPTRQERQEGYLPPEEVIGMNRHPNYGY